MRADAKLDRFREALCKAILQHGIEDEADLESAWRIFRRIAGIARDDPDHFDDRLRAILRGIDPEYDAAPRRRRGMSGHPHHRTRR